MLTFTDEQFAELLEASTGQRPTWSAEAFPELEGDVRASIEKMTSSPFIPNQGSVRGFVYDVHSGGLSEVR